WLGALDHQDVPFERLVDDLAPDRSLARHPLLQVTLALQDDTPLSAGLAGVRASIMPAGTAGARCDMDVHPGGGAGAGGRPGRLRGYLRAAGAGPETVVGLCLDRGVDLVTAVVGTWLAGAAYLPLDPAYPADRLAFMLADSRAAVVAGTSAAVENLPAGRLPV